MTPQILSKIAEIRNKIGTHLYHAISCKVNTRPHLYESLCDCGVNEEGQRTLAILSALEKAVKGHPMACMEVGK